MEENDFIKYYDLESYIFEGVNTKFHKYGFLSAFDFFTIIIWKANRAKSKISKRILGRGYDTSTTVLKLLRMIFIDVLKIRKD